MHFLYCFKRNSCYGVSVSVFDFDLFGSVCQNYTVYSVFHIMKQIVQIHTFIGSFGFFAVSQVCIVSSGAALILAFHIAYGKRHTVFNSRALNRQGCSRNSVNVIRSILVFDSAVCNMLEWTEREINPRSSCYFNAVNKLYRTCTVTIKNETA